MGITSSGAPHHAKHENGGADEVDATGLTGVGGGSALKLTRTYKAFATQNVLDATLTAVTFDQEVIDDDAQHSTVTNTSRVTVVATDVYDIMCAVKWDGDASGSYRRCEIWVNGVDLLDDDANQTPVADKVQHVFVPGTSLTAGDYVEVKVQQDSGGTRTIVTGFATTFVLVRRGTSFQAFESNGAGALTMTSAYDTIAQYDAGDGVVGSISMYGGLVDVNAAIGGDSVEILADASVPSISMFVFGTGIATEIIMDLDFSVVTSGSFVATAGGATKQHRLTNSDGVVFPNLAADPTPGYESQTYWNTVTHKLRCWDGTSWNNLF